MPLRNRTNRDAPSESQQVDEGTQGNQDLSEQDELSASLLSSVSAREKCRRERVKEKKAKDMSEQEMMDLALHLSEQEASDSALQRQQEEEAMMKAIRESMVSQRKPCPSSQSQSLLAEADASLRPCSQTKHLHKSMVSKADQADLDVCAPDRKPSQVATEARGEKNNRIRKRKMREDNLLLELPDLPQTKRICSQSSTYGSGSLPVFFDTGQSCDSTQIDDDQLHKSPVFPLTGSKAEVHVPRLSQDLLDTCRTSGFVLCSQYNSQTTNTSPPTQPRSPTFPKSQRNPPFSQSTIACPKSPVFSETDQGDDTETQLSPEYIKSPVFGKTTQQDSSSRACKSQVSVCSPTRDNSGSIYSSQESFTSCVGPASCRPKSPVFPRTPSLPDNHAPSECSEIPQCSLFLDENERHDKQNTSPVPDKMFRPQKMEHDRIPILSRRSSISFEEIKEHSQHLRQDDKIKTNTSVPSDDAEELNEISRDLSERELTSDMTLHWSDDDEDMTVMGSPSPVFPKESPVHQADSRGASLTNVAAASLETNEPKPSLKDQSRVSSQSPVTSAPAASHRQQCSTTEQASQMGGSQDAGQAGPSASRPTVHYYWGVPFCPRGLDADTYTQVILAQMEVYEKSLKQAQRCLLRKAEWGEGISPQPEKSPSPESPGESSQQLIPRRRRLRLRGKKLSEEADSPPVESEEDEEGKRKEEEEKRKGNKVGKTESGGRIHLDPDDDEVCPETQLSDDSTQDLTMYIEDEPESTKQPDVEMILQDNNSVVDDSQDETEMEVDARVGKGLEGQEPVSSRGEGQPKTREEQQQDKEEGGGDLDVEEIKERALQRSPSPELDPVAVPPSPESNVECPICQGFFPAAKIEMHAAYCDGEVTVLDKKMPETICLQGSSKLRRTKTRRAGEEVNTTSNNLEIQEKCCTCQRSFPLRVYSRHKELCTQQLASKSLLKIDEASAMEQNEDTDSEVSLTRRMMMKRRRWGMTGLRDSQSETHPSGHSCQSQKSAVAMVTSKGNCEPRRQANYKDEDCWYCHRIT